MLTWLIIGKVSQPRYTCTQAKTIVLSVRSNSKLQNYLCLFHKARVWSTALLETLELDPFQDHNNGNN